MNKFIAQVNLTANGKKFIAGQKYTETEIKGVSANNFLFDGVEKIKTTKKKVIARTIKKKKRGRPKLKK